MYTEESKLNWYAYEPRYNIGDICLSYPVVHPEPSKYVLITEVYTNVLTGNEMYRFLDLHTGQMKIETTVLFEHYYGYVS